MFSNKRLSPWQTRCKPWKEPVSPVSPHTRETSPPSPLCAMPLTHHWRNPRRGALHHTGGRWIPTLQSYTCTYACPQYWIAGKLDGGTDDECLYIESLPISTPSQIGNQKKHVSNWWPRKWKSCWTCFCERIFLMIIIVFSGKKFHLKLLDFFGIE